MHICATPCWCQPLVKSTSSGEMLVHHARDVGRHPGTPAVSPFEQAREVYDREPCARTFDEDRRLHDLHGFVFSTPDYFIMGRPVPRNAAPAMIINPAVSFRREDCDCWHIYLMAGDIARAWDVLPWELPWLSFERKNDLRFYPAARIRELSLTDREVLPQCAHTSSGHPILYDSKAAEARPSR